VSARVAFPSSGYNNLGVLAKAVYVSDGRRSVEGRRPFFGSPCRYPDDFFGCTLMCLRILMTWHYSLSNWPTQCKNSCFIISLLYSFTCFEHCCAHHQWVKILLYSIWYHHTCRWPSRAQVERGPVHGTATYRCDDIGYCINTIWPPDDEHIVLETYRGI